MDVEHCTCCEYFNNNNVYRPPFVTERALSDIRHVKKTFLQTF